MMKKIFLEQVKNLPIERIDENIEISILEYGILLFQKEEKDEFILLYGIGFDELNYITFDFNHFSISDFVECAFINWEDICHWLGVDNKTEFLQLPKVLQVGNLVNYYGMVNFYGYSEPIFNLEDMEEVLEQIN